MEKNNAYLKTARQVNRIRSLYSEIGQPLPADIIAELYRHLDRVQEAAKPRREKQKRKRIFRI